MMSACMASLLPAWLPPLMMLKAGTGRYLGVVVGGGAMGR